MKQLLKLCLLMVLFIMASCQSESVDNQQNENQAELRFKDGNVISDGLLEEKELVFDKDSEKLIKTSNELATAKTGYYGGYYGGGSNNNSGSDACSIDTIEAMLPSQVTVTTTAKPGTDAYFNLTINDNSGYLSGTNIPAWCADQDLSLNNNETVDFDVYSTYGDLPEGVFEKPQNFDKVNWLLNQTIIGEESPNGLGAYNFGHVQYAIWLLIDDSVCYDCVYLSDPTGNWNDDGNDVAQAHELKSLALSQGAGFTPSCGEQMAIVLVPDGKQSVIVTKEVEADSCEDCLGKVTDLTLEWDWYYNYRVKIYQRYENTCYAVKIYDQVVGHGDTIDLSGVNWNGTFGDYVYVYVGNCYYTKFRTDCDINIGPGYKRGVLEVVSGESSLGGELCEYEPSYNWCWWW
ncbi:hypothetical protein [Winogradskyella sp. SYSU M77433]|uniref:hypothetical protein n=1 Tax=Winogradskyella sp. SYSU M77433 TaxID=3042722 RepID=UPI0024806814|nr:hypothetical protein [Winogradskyella sp. SYSU M77433]MDH7912625.1 hypothetical protein [Winogradskyella sp. SYSU M77433]